MRYVFAILALSVFSTAFAQEGVSVGRDVVEQDLLGDIDFEKTKTVVDDETFSIKLFTRKRDAISIQLVLWLGEEERITFFIEDREIFDDYVKSDNDVKKQIAFLKNLLSNEVIQIRYHRNGETEKIVDRYQLLGNDGITTLCEDKFTVRPSFFWNKNEESKKVYQPWIG